MSILRMIYEEFGHFFHFMKQRCAGGYQHLHFPMNSSSGREMNELIEMHMLLLQNHVLFWGSNYTELSIEQ